MSGYWHECHGPFTDLGMDIPFGEWQPLSLELGLELLGLRKSLHSAGNL